MKRSLLAGMALLLVLSPIRGQTAEQKKATVAYLRKLQNKDGGFRPLDGRAPSSLRATSAAVKALHYFGGQAGDQDAARDFVRHCFDEKAGAFADRPGGEPGVFPTAIGIMAVVELKMPAGPYADAVVKYLGKNARTFEDIRIAAAGLEAIDRRPPQAADWLDQIGRMRNADGTYGKVDGKARETGGAVVAVLRLGGKVESANAVLDALKEGQRKDGGWCKPGADRSDLDSSYRVMRAFHMLKARPDVDPLRAFIARCRNRDGGYGLTPGAASSVSGTYCAGIILHWLEEAK